MVCRLLILVVICFVFLYACQSNSLNNSEHIRTLAEPLIVNRLFDGTYEIISDESVTNRPLYVSEDPNNLFDNKPKYTLTTDTFRIESKQNNDRRLFFGYNTSHQTGDTLYHIVSERLIPLEGQVNCRDLGGIPTKTGRVTKWGKIFRSGQLDLLTNRDLEYLASMQLKTVLDFRNDIEIEKKPDRIPNHAIYVRAPIADKDGKHYRSLKKQMMLHKIRSADSKAKFTEIMEAFVDTAATDYKPVVDHLLNPSQAPLLFHCAGGKDRTGAMAAIILMSLDVDKDVIRDEYFMSNFYRYFFNQEKMKEGRRMLLGKGTLENAFIVQEEYIDAVFSIVENKYSGIDNYLSVKFDLSPEDRQKLIWLYTTDPRQSTPIQTKNQ